MTGRIDEIQLIGLPITGPILQSYALGFDRNAAFPFQIHGIQHLFGHFPLAQAAANLDETVGQSGFAVIDMGNDGKITDGVH
jgi:hypothetical protein